MPLHSLNSTLQAHRLSSTCAAAPLVKRVGAVAPSLPLRGRQQRHAVRPCLAAISRLTEVATSSSFQATVAAPAAAPPAAHSTPTNQHHQLQPQKQASTQSVPPIHAPFAALASTIVSSSIHAPFAALGVYMACMAAAANSTDWWWDISVVGVLYTGLWLAAVRCARADLRTSWGPGCDVSRWRVPDTVCSQVPQPPLT